MVKFDGQTIIYLGHLPDRPVWCCRDDDSQRIFTHLLVRALQQLLEFSMPATAKVLAWDVGRRKHGQIRL